jgi:tRNA (guanine6-N2)-methyltransferase
MSFSAQNLPFFALTTSGLEATSAKEVALLPHVSIRTISYRRISATCSGSLASLCSLRTVDDVFLEIATWTDIGRPRKSLERLRYLSACLDLHAAAACCARLRPVRMPPAFSLTVSFVGKRNYTGEEIKTVLAHEIGRKHHGWTYQQDDRAADLNIRVFLEHEVATVGVRVGKTALHDRWYQRAHLPGALKPSVAAALALLAQTTSTTTVVDPCCGSGTILIETALQGAIVCGGDRSPLAVAAARANASAAGINVSIQQWDATSLPIADAVMDRVITNLPWGRQVPVNEALPSLYQRMFAQMRRVLAPSGRLVVLTNAPEEIDPLDLSCVEQIEISLFGQRPTILIFSSTHASH